MKCRNCGWDNAPGYVRCEKCGSPLAVGAPAHQNHSFCTNCGYPLARGGAVCPNCGAPVMRQAAPAPVAPVPQPAPAARGEETVLIDPKAPAPKPAPRPAQAPLPITDPKPIPAPMPAFQPIQLPAFTLEPIGAVLAENPSARIKYEGPEVSLNRQNTEPGNASITSKVQSLIKNVGGEWFIEDKSTLQTTFVHVTRPTLLHDGDVILLGNRLFRFKKQNS